ncbi:MAG TPA: hypothetical protein VJY42_01705 [Candidatus Methanomethylophilaceae archaeon]|nr:hypothetical protein [Candidatus Methanomethylophilaceae archaeon]
MTDKNIDITAEEEALKSTADAQVKESCIMPETERDEFYDYDDVEVLQSAVDRKMVEIEEMKGNLSRARSEANKNKYGDMINFLQSDIVGYRTVISDLMDTECDISDLDYDPDEVPNYDTSEIYEIYLKDLSEEDRDMEQLADAIRSDYFDDVLDDVFYSVGMKILSNGELLDAIADCDSVLIELGRAAVMEDTLYDLIFTDASEDDFEEYCKCDQSKKDKKKDKKEVKKMKDKKSKKDEKDKKSKKEEMKIKNKEIKDKKSKKDTKTEKKSKKDKKKDKKDKKDKKKK